MKKIIIGVVVVLLIAGVIGGSFALANHFKKPDVTPDEKPVEQEKVFQKAVLTDGVKVDKIYINPDYTFNESDSEVFTGDKFFLMINEDEFTGLEDKQSLFIIGSGNPLNTNRNFATLEYNHYEDEMMFYVKEKFMLAKAINDGDIAYTVKGTLADINITYNADEKSLDLSKLNYTLILNKERINELKKIDFISLEPFYVLKDSVVENDVENKDEVVEPSETAVLAIQQTLDNLYVKDSLPVDMNSWKNYKFFDGNSNSVPFAIFIKTPASPKTYSEQELKDIFASTSSLQEFVGTNDGNTAFLTPCYGTGVYQLAIKNNLNYDETFKYEWFCDIKKEPIRTSVNIMQTPGTNFICDKNGVINMEGYTLLIDPAKLADLVKLNVMSTVPYPVVA